MRGFLNLGALFPIGAGVWDPSLAFVMGAGATLSLAAHQYAAARLPSGPLLADAYSYPIQCEFGTEGAPTKDLKARLLDPRLLSGAALFGIGWGFLGICPGPSIVGLATPMLGGDSPWRFPAFVAASIVGAELAESVAPAAPMPPARALV